MAKEGLCSSCSNSIRCDTWAEWKCTKRAIRFSSYGYSMPAKCSDYVKRPKNWKEMKCQCEDCLKNESLTEELEESED